MTPERWSRVKALFSESVELPVAERPDFLSRQAADDTALMAEVQSLLEAHEQPGEFLDKVTQDFRAEAFGLPGIASSRIGERIGAYRIIGVLGTGGMGDVYRAVRDDAQYHAEVAVKLMRADARSSLTEQRFRTERQILAGLDHRNIARLLDGGTTDHGVPYLVMELVAGEPIDGYSAARNLGVRDRVQLFLQVCAAVSYAHQHLIVHRDLKPNNILVTPDGSVKLLDFGIAKLLEADKPTMEAAGGTVTTLRAMTLEYASPEQLSGGTVTTVSDVYSLGVVLYRLMTGKSPYAVRANEAARIAEILSDATPTRPSQIARKVDGDLDNILLMALRKEPQRRYASVEQFADDLRNYLSGMPVKARGNSLRYRAGKFVRRRKVEMAAGGFVACALLGALVFSMREARIAEHERQLAQRHFDSVRKLANTLLFDIHGEMEKVAGSTRARERLVSTSLEYLDALYKQAATDRQLQLELGTAYSKVAEIQGNDIEANKGDFEAALRNWERAIGLLTQLATAEPDNHRAGWALAYARVEQASLLMVARGPKYALESAQLGVALSERHGPSIADRRQATFRLGNAYAVQARILAFMDRRLEAMPSFDKFVTVSEEYARAHPDDEVGMRSLSTAYNNAALVDDPRLPEAVAYERSLALLRKSMAVAERLLARNPVEPARQASVAMSRFNIGNFLYTRGQYAEALQLYRQAAPVAVAAAADTDDAAAQYNMALFESAEARALFKTGEVEAARVLFLKSAKTFETVLARDGSLRTEYGLGQNAIRLSELYAQLASSPREDREGRLRLWKLAHDSLQRGLASVHKVTAVARLQSVDMLVVLDGEALLPGIEAAIAKLEGATPIS
jgi:tRNA A-37 threonylcarbamoyl transferase component Bud32/tetratricopeptide (TPR) repeat protein